MTTYTVFRSDESEIADRGLTLEQAALELLGADGYEHVIRPMDGGGFRLWISQHSRNSTIGAHLVSSRFFSVETDRDMAEREIYQQVIGHDRWHGYQAMTDTEFDRKIAAEAE